MRPTLSAFDSNLLKCNGKYIALNASGIGSVIVIPVTETGKAPEQVPMFRGHTGGSVLDTDFDPFDDQRFVSCGEDGKIMIWDIPQDYTFIHNDPKKIQDVKPVGELVGHTRKVGHVVFSPVAKDILASSSFDYSVKIWNVATKKCVMTLQHKDLITSFCFNYNGTKIASASRDKHIRVWDVRSGKLLCEGKGHPGAKASRIVWLGKSDTLFTTGFDRYSERQLALWNANDLSSGPIGGFYPLDSSSGVLVPYFDLATSLVFVAGKGDGNIRYYEVADGKLYDISEFQSINAQRGIAFAPKRSVNVKENEILRAYKLLNDNSVEPVSFIVPRRSEMFQEDIYPDAPAGIPALTAEEFLSGKTVDGPTLVSMRDIYDGAEKPSTKTAEEEEKEQKANEVVPASVEKPKEASTKKVEAAKTKISAPTEKTEPAKKVEAVRPVFTKSQEQGVDAMLNGKTVNKLLEKVENASDDDTQDVDADNEEWESVEVNESEKKREEKKKEEERKEKERKKEEERKMEEKKEEEKKVKAKEEKKKTEDQRQTEPPKLTKETKVGAKDDATVAKSSKKAVGLKANVEKLQALVEKLEGTVSTLIEANIAKDEHLRQIESKLDQLLNHSA